MSLFDPSTAAAHLDHAETRGPSPRWFVQLGWIALSAVLLSLSFAPFGLAWLAWVALAPMLVVLTHCRNIRQSALAGLLLGVMFFGANLWWLWTATIPGMIAAMLYLSIVWGLTGALMGVWMRRASDIRHCVGAQLFVPAIWCGGEYVRSIGYLAFPWMLVGQSQSPWLAMCQIADCSGVIGISFCVMSVNALAAMAWMNRRNRAALALPGALTAILLIAAGAYGVFRMRTEKLEPGPRVAVVQSNHRYLRGGERTISREEAAEWCLSTVQSLLKTESLALVVLPETAMPPLNPDARQNLGRSTVGPFLQRTNDQLESLAATHATSIITGGHYVGGWSAEGKLHTAHDLRNSAFLYTPSGLDKSRYDKIELVPFAETLPFKSSVPWLHHVLLTIAAASAEQADTPGDADSHTVFSIKDHTFITPICFENIDGAFVASAIRSADSDAKRADFIVNLTNDGWFAPVEHAQHFQAILFRAIENRVPIARCSNTGISGFIDPLGRVGPTLAVGSEGYLAANVQLDARRTFYTTHPRFFGFLCLLLTIISIALGLRKWSK